MMPRWRRQDGDRHRIVDSRELIALCFLALVVLTTGCSKTLKFTEVSKESQPPTDPKRIEFLPIEALSSGQFEIVGKVFARHKGGMLMGKGADDLQNTVKKAAAKLGADAVIGFKTSKQDDERMNSGNSRWGSGIAVRRIKGSPGVPERSDFIVAVCGDRSMTFDDWKRDKAAEAGDTSNEDFAKDSLRNEKNWTYVLSAAEYQLEKRGYYTMITPASQMNISADSLSHYQGEMFDKLFGFHANHVVHLDLVGASTYNTVVAAGASAQVKAILYSKAAGAVVWENSASKTLFPTFIYGWGSLLESGETRRQKAVGKAVKKLFESLQPIN